MSNLSGAETGRVATFLESSIKRLGFRRPTGELNLYRAARYLTDELRVAETGKPIEEVRKWAERKRLVDRHRKMIERVLAGETQTLRMDQAERLLRLAAMVSPENAEKAGEIWADIQTRDTATDRLRDMRWAEPADGSEVIALRLTTWDAEDLKAAKMRERPQPCTCFHLPSQHRLGTGSCTARACDCRRYKAETHAIDQWVDKNIAVARRLLVKAPLTNLLPYLDRFEEQSLKAGHDKIRVRYAIRRFFGPFCQWSRSGGACRGWHQMSRPEQARAFHAGLTMERAWIGKPAKPDDFTPSEPEVSGTWAAIGRYALEDLERRD